jgi:VanZ family protein
MFNRLHVAAFVFCFVCWTIALLVPVPHKEAEVVIGGADSQFWFGKTLHVCAYAFLTVLGGSITLTRTQRWFILALMSFHGFATEFFQQFVPGRTAAWRDVGLDHIGIALGILVGWRWWRGLLPPETKVPT